MYAVLNTVICCYAFLVSASLGRDFGKSPFHPFEAGSSEPCYGVCLSKEIKMLHEEINAIGTQGSELKQVENTTAVNSAKLDSNAAKLKQVENTTAINSAKLDKTADKLDELLQVVQNCTGSTKELEALRRLQKLLEEKVADLDKKNDDLKAENTEKTVEIAKQKTDIAKLTTEIAEQKAENTKQKTDISKLTTENAKLKADLGEALKNRKDFRLILPSMTWSDARNHCVKLGGRLAFADNESEHSRIKSAAGGHNVWIGLSYSGSGSIGQKSSWRTSCGRPPRYDGWGSYIPSRDDNWRCAYQDYGSRKWYDYSCSHKLPFVCQFGNKC